MNEPDGTSDVHSFFRCSSVVHRAEKSAEAFREQKFNGMCVPEVPDLINDSPYFPNL